VELAGLLPPIIAPIFTGSLVSIFCSIIPLTATELTLVKGRGLPHVWSHRYGHLESRFVVCGWMSRLLVLGASSNSRRLSPSTLPDVCTGHFFHVDVIT
jgi:hypothetical protein